MSFSKIISIILHPIFIPLITIRATLFFASSLEFIIYPYLNFVMLTIILSTIVFPLLVILFLIKIRKVKSLEISDSKERPIPLICSALIMFIGYSIIEPILTLVPVLKAEFIGAIIIVSLASFISKYWKISLHMLGAGGGVGVFIGIHIFYGGLAQLILFALLLSGVLGIARINEKAHNQAQIYVGFLMGLFIQLGSLSLL